MGFNSQVMKPKTTKAKESRQTQLEFGLTGYAETFAMHPSGYQVIKPKHMIGAREDLNLPALKLFQEILAINHAQDPEQLLYEVPYANITESKNAKFNAASHIRRPGGIGDILTQTNHYFPEEAYYAITGKRRKNGGYVSLIETVDCHQGCFQVKLTETFKKALILERDNYLSGELDFLRTLRSASSIRLYWAIREAQFRGKQEKTFELLELKQLLGMEDKYPMYQDFRKRVLEVVRKEFEAKWVQFEYEPIKKGRGGAVQAIRFIFTPDRELTKQLIETIHKQWQKTLHFKYHFSLGRLQWFTQKLGKRVREDSEVVWSDLYIDYTIWKVDQRDWEAKWNSAVEEVKQKSAYLYKALVEGYYVEEVAKEEVKRRASQQARLEMPESEKRSKKKKVMDEEELREQWQRDFSSISWAEFLRVSGYVSEDGKLVKYY